MNKKIVGILICMLFIGTIVIPVSSIDIRKNPNEVSNWNNNYEETNGLHQPWVWLGCHDGHTENCLKWNDGSPFTEAIELSSPEIDPYIGYVICEVEVSGGCDDYGFYANDFEVYVSSGSLPDMTVIGDDETLVASGTSSVTGWTTIATGHYQILGTTYVIVKWLGGYIGKPAGVDESNSNPKCGYMLEQGTTNDWSITLVDYHGLGVWGLGAGICGCSPNDVSIFVPTISGWGHVFPVTLTNNLVGTNLHNINWKIECNLNPTGFSFFWPTPQVYPSSQNNGVISIFPMASSMVKNSAVLPTPGNPIFSLGKVDLNIVITADCAITYTTTGTFYYLKLLGTYYSYIIIP